MYPNHFYFSQKTLEVRYSHIPSGEISVDRLIKNQPYWKLPITTSPKKPKTLILADWTMANWSMIGPWPIGLSKRNKRLSVILFH